jgi:phage I-like protein
VTIEFENQEVVKIGIALLENQTSFAALTKMQTGSTYYEKTSLVKMRNMRKNNPFLSL